MDCLPALYFVGGVACLMNRKCQRLGDLAANTIVVRYPRVTEPDLEQLLAGKFNSLRQYPHLDGAAAAADFARGTLRCYHRALLRRDEFQPAARIELFRDLAEHFGPRRSFRRKRPDGITDEQYIRNAGQSVLYRTRTGRKMEALAA